MLLISKADARHPGALCRVVRETESRYDVEVLEGGPHPWPLSVEGGYLPGAHTWVVKHNVVAVNVSREDYGDYLASYHGIT
jgi:hypothetical protein